MLAGRMQMFMLKKHMLLRYQLQMRNPFLAGCTSRTPGLYTRKICAREARMAAMAFLCLLNTPPVLHNTEREAPHAAVIQHCKVLTVGIAVAAIFPRDR